MIDAPVSIQGRRGGVSPWAILSLICSFGVCPFVTIIALPLGLLGLRDVRRNGKRGRRAAWLGIIISLLITPLTGWGMAWYNATVREPMLHGPRDAIIDAMRGDAVGFNGAFLPGDEGGPAQVEAFAAVLKSRWGMLESVMVDRSRLSPATSLFEPIRVPYVFLFETGPVPGEAELIVFQRTDAGTNLVARFAWVIIGTADSDAPPVSWPATAAGVERPPLEAAEGRQDDATHE